MNSECFEIGDGGFDLGVEGCFGGVGFGGVLLLLEGEQLGELLVALEDGVAVIPELGIE